MLLNLDKNNTKEHKTKICKIDMIKNQKQLVNSNDYILPGLQYRMNKEA